MIAAVLVVAAIAGESMDRRIGLDTLTFPIGVVKVVDPSLSGRTSVFISLGSYYSDPHPDVPRDKWTPMFGLSFAEGSEGPLYLLGLHRDAEAAKYTENYFRGSIIFEGGDGTRVCRGEYSSSMADGAAKESVALEASEEVLAGLRDAKWVTARWVGDRFKLDDLQRAVIRKALEVGADREAWKKLDGKSLAP